MENTNINNLKVGDEIFIEDAWEDEAGNLHGESAIIKGIDEKGELDLDWSFTTNGKVREFLEMTDSYMANDYKVEVTNQP